MLTAEKKKFTKEDYQSLDDGAAFQLINADLILSPSPIADHKKILLNLVIQIKSYMAQCNDRGELLIAPLDVHFDEENIFQPDLFYIKEDRKVELIQDFIYGAPDLIIEILSPATAYYDLRQKKDVYERYGVNEYIIIDPIQLNGEIYGLKNGQLLLRQKASKSEVLRSGLLKGLKIDLHRLFK
jgi:Uma2 family endonuclease